MRPADILLAEDERELQLSISLWLKAMGHHVTLASDGVEALTKLLEMQSNADSCDLLVCDIQMPGMNGEALIETIRSREIDIPILAISGYGNKSLVVRLMRLGCDDFIDKPFDPETLEKHIGKALQSADRKRKKKRETVSLQKHMEQTQQIVHDVNNLLGIAVGYTDMALEDLTGPDEIRTKLKTVMSSSKKAAEICDQFLSIVSRITSEKVRTNLNILVHRVASLFREILPSNISLKHAVPPIHLWIDGDADRIQQALLNLGLNALDAMPNGGTLSIELACDEVVEETSPKETPNLTSIGTCRIIVSDTGTGINSSIIHRVFDKGFTTKSNGNGLGLHAVRQIAEEHGGEITVENEEGGGTRFELILPLAAMQSKVSLTAKSDCLLCDFPVESDRLGDEQK